MDSRKKIWSWNIFLLSKDIHPFILRDLELFSLSSFQYIFFFFFSLLFSAPSLYFGILKIFEEKTNFKFFFGWDGSGYTMNMKVGQLRIYRWFTHTLKWTYACQYFWVRLANKISQRNKIDLKIFQNSKRTHPLTKLNTHTSCYVDNYLALVGMQMWMRTSSKFILLWEIS